MYSQLFAIGDSVKYVGTKFKGELGPNGEGTFAPGKVVKQIDNDPGKFVVVFCEGSEKETSIICPASVLAHRG